MARIQLRDTTIYLQDGLSGSAAVDLPPSAFAVPPVVRTIPGTAAPAVDEVQTCSQFANVPSGGTYTLTINDGVNTPATTSALAFGAAAAAIETAIDVAMTGATYPGWTNGDITVTESGAAGISDGTVTLTFDGTSVAATPFLVTVVDGDLLTGVSVTGSGSLWVDTNALNSDITTLIPVGARFTIAGETGSPTHTVVTRNAQVTNIIDGITFTPVLAAGVADDAVITFLPQRLEINIGEGDLTWTESKEYIYDLDRDQLDSVREGQEQPVEVDLAFIFDFVTTESGQEITPVDALKQIGEASEWVSSSSDQCEPYAVDIYALNCVPCGTEEDQDFLFADFRYESLEYSIQDASISVSGRCNVSNVITTRADFPNCA